MHSAFLKTAGWFCSLALGAFALSAQATATPPAPANKAAPKPVTRPAGARPAAAAASPAAKEFVPTNVGELCAALAERVTDIDPGLCVDAQLRPSGAKSVRGTPIFQTDVSVPRAAAASEATPARRRVLVIGAIHGDELSSAAVAFHWLRLAHETGGQIEWRFVPVLNPDGMFMAKPQRMNANGVDLNRNFPTPNWATEAPTYWESRTKRDPRRYPGPKPLSEPESRWLYDEMERYKPHLIVSIHAPYGVLDFDGPTVPPQRLGRLYLDQVGIYPGSLGNYGGVHKRVPVVTIELNNAVRTPTSIEMRQMWLDMLRWIGERLPE